MNNSFNKTSSLLINIQKAYYVVQQTCNISPKTAGLSSFFEKAFTFFKKKILLKIV